MLNTVFALFEILCTNSPPAPWITLPICILFLAMYLGVAYITHATQGIYSTYFLVISCLRLSSLRRVTFFPSIRNNLNIPLSPVSPAYSFLDPTTQGPVVAAYIVGILVGYAVVFNLVRMVIVLRERWAIKNGNVLRMSGNGAETRSNASIDDDWEEVESPVSVARAKGDV